MGYCKDCTHWYTRWDSNDNEYMYCNEIKQRVTRNGSCDYFKKKPTPADAHYTDGSSGGCFLTTACVDYMGKKDDCEQLQTLRRFRDTYVKSTEEGKKLVEEYYSVAPLIVEKINASENKEITYRNVYEIIIKCCTLIDSGENESALNEYKSMVSDLKNAFGL